MEIFDLTGKTALITGASSGLGEGFARTLSEAGARVILTARRFEKLEALAEDLQNAIALEMDVSNKESVKKAIGKLEAHNVKIDICVNNAGILKPTPIFEEDDDKFESLMQTNVMGVWYVTKEVANHMRNHNIEGSIINIGSVNGANCLDAEFSGYSASKAAVMQMTKALVGELAKEKIRINCIVPGLFQTDMIAHNLNDKNTRKQMEAFIPLHFIAKPEDLDGTILYLASNKASRYVTGSCLTVDGGISWGG